MCIGFDIMPDLRVCLKQIKTNAYKVKYEKCNGVYHRHWAILTIEQIQEINKEITTPKGKRK